MKKLLLTSVAALTCISLSACRNTNNSKQSKQDREASSLKVANSKLKEKARRESIKKKTSSSFSVSNTSTISGSNQQQNNKQLTRKQQTQSSNVNQPKSQSEINRERGYDPNGQPLLPGQDHAAGANPDGTPDAWVQGQINWAKQNGYLNPDGSPTAKEQEAEREVEQDSQ